MANEMTRTRISPDDVQSREDFVRFVRDLASETQKADRASANLDLPTYLEAVSGWANDMPRYFANEHRPVPEVGWALFAMILEAAVHYE